MESQTKLRNALAWAGIILIAAAGLLLLEWPLTRPWFIGILMTLMVGKLAHSAYLLARGSARLNRGFVEGLATSIGVLCLMVNMMWDRPMFSFVGYALMLGSMARRWHEERRVSDSSGTIAR